MIGLRVEMAMNMGADFRRNLRLGQRYDGIGYVYDGCKCQPRENGLVYLGEDACLQDCGLFNLAGPRECACKCNEKCGPVVCGSKTCAANERCSFDTTSGDCSCQADPTCGVPEVCDDGIDNDGDGKIDCADPDCCAKTGPGGVICCAGSNPGICCTGGFACDLSTNTCRVTCTKNSECAAGRCCDRDPAIADIDKGIGTCNYALGSIYKNKYLCDPPGWNLESEEESIPPRTLILWLPILNPFS